MSFLTKIIKNKYFQFFLIAVFFCLVVILRRPDAVTYPQFYAEDGYIWYADAYNAVNFWKPFLVPICGYFQTVSRLGGFTANFFDIKYGPIIFNAIAIFIQILPALFFLSSRFKKLVPKLYQRFFCSLTYLLLLATAETHANLTNAQWRLSILMFLIIIAPETKKTAWKIFDIFFLVLAGLSGPFVFFALPIAFIFNFYKKSFKIFYDRLVALGVSFSIQFYGFFLMSNPEAMRSKAKLGASSVLFLKILARNIFLRSLFARKYIKTMAGWNLWKNGYLPVAVGLLGIFILGYVLWQSRIELKLFIVFAFSIFFAALISPDASLSASSQWEYMAGGGAARYYLLPKLAWMISLGWLLFVSKIKYLRFAAGTAFFCFIFLGLIKDRAFDSYGNYHFPDQVKEFRKVSPGEQYIFKIVPGWKMFLIKK